MSRPVSDDSDDQFCAPTWRRRLLVLLLAVVTAVTIVLTLLYPPGGVQRKAPPPPADVARCAPGQTQDCVGGVASVGRIALARIFHTATTVRVEGLF